MTGESHERLDLAPDEFRALGHRAIDEYLDALNQRIADGIRESGEAVVMTTAINDRTVLRLSICSHRTTLEDPGLLDRDAEFK